MTSSEPDAADACTFINHLLQANEENTLSSLFRACLEYTARHSACQRALRSLEGAKAESMMTRLHQVGPIRRRSTVRLFPDSFTVDFCPSDTRHASAKGGVDAFEAVRFERCSSQGAVHPRRQHWGRPRSVDQRRLCRRLSGNVPWSAGRRQALAYPK
jgi:hypothetical protein